MKKVDTSEKKICHDCIDEAYLKAEVKAKGTRIKCSYCEDNAKGYTLKQLIDRIETAFLTHYERTPEQPSEWEYMRQHVDKESSYYWTREGEAVEDLLVDIVGISPIAASDIQRALQHKHAGMGDDPGDYESEFDSEAMYQSKGISDESWQTGWGNFERILKSESRYFSKTIEDYLKSIFDGIENYKTFYHRPLITLAGPEENIKTLYRARTFQTEDKLLEAISYPDKQLGTPPSIYALSGRMNAAGIAVFYGATNPETALAEVRPPVGSYVAVAQFEIVRELRLLNLTELSKASSEGSIFDPNYSSRLEKALFLRSLSERMVMPVMPDHESFEYLPTQVIADFLASQTDIVYDGIIFPSVQAAGSSINVVLFHKSARVANIDLPYGARIHASSKAYEEDLEYEYYNVLEIKPSKKYNKLAYHQSANGYLTKPEEGNPIDDRKISLKVNLDAIHVHHIKAVKYDTDPHNVNRSSIIRKYKPKDILDF